MVNHPNRSQRTRRYVLWQGNIRTATVYLRTIADAPYEPDTAWRSGPTCNNRSAPISFFTERMDDLTKRLSGCGYTKDHLDTLKAAIAAAGDGDELQWTSNDVYYGDPTGYWRKL